MGSIPQIKFESKIKTIESFKEYISKNNIKMPPDRIIRRCIFIEWFLKENMAKSISENIRNLSENYLYISESTIEYYIFYESSKNLNQIKK